MTGGKHSGAEAETATGAAAAQIPSLRASAASRSSGLGIAYSANISFSFLAFSINCFPPDVILVPFSGDTAVLEGRTCSAEESILPC